MRIFPCLLGLIALAGCAHKASESAPVGKTIELKAADGATVYAYLSKAKSPKGIILLFHQADSSAAEYAPIIPKLTDLGWDCLSVDQRSGGSMYGTNRTVEALGRNADYMSAYQDLEAALLYANDQKYKDVVAWGSSYSASLVGRLASEHKEVTKLVAFSPGEYMDDQTIVHKWYLGVRIPAIAIWSGDEETSVTALMEGTKVEVIGSKDYIHGSSTLRPDKPVPDQKELWKQIERFLNAN